jgi:leucyl-tRNA synthetase
VEFRPDGESPLKKCRSFIETTCPACGGPAERDADTLYTFVCSSWYQFRYVDSKNDREPFAKQRSTPLVPVDKYIGGPNKNTPRMHRLLCPLHHQSPARLAVQSI